MLALGACHSAPGEVDAGLLSYVDPQDREAIAEARRERDEAADEVAIARRRVEETRGELGVARTDLEVQEARRERAAVSARVDAKSSGEEPGRDPVAEASYSDMEETRQAVARARDTIEWRQQRIVAAKEEVEVAEARRDLAEANVELVKAQAVARLDRPEAERIDVEHHRQVVRQREADLKVAEVRFRAAREEADLAKERIGRDRDQGVQERRDEGAAEVEEEPLRTRTEAEREEEEQARRR